jgi:hypothetical protein
LDDIQWGSFRRKEVSAKEEGQILAQKGKAVSGLTASN